MNKNKMCLFVLGFQIDIIACFSSHTSIYSGIKLHSVRSYGPIILNRILSRQIE